MRYLFVIFLLMLSGCTSLKDIFIKPELHGIGVYEGTDPQDDGVPWHQKCGNLSSVACHRAMTKRKTEIGGQVVVNISITDKPLILAFTAHDKTKWILKAEEGVIIEKVILAGYHAQTIEGIPKETAIEVYTHDGSPCPRCYQGGGYFYSYKSPPPQLSEIAGYPVKSWQGKYRGLEFSIFPGIKGLSRLE